MSNDAKVTKMLMETLEDGREGYLLAAERLAGSDRPEIAVKMREFSEQRSAFYADLERMAAAYGDDLDEDGSTMAAAHRGWMKVQDAITGTDTVAVIDTALGGENHAVSVYEEAIESDISSDLHDVAKRQLASVEKARADLQAFQTSLG